MPSEKRPSEKRPLKILAGVLAIIVVVLGGLLFRQNGQNSDLEQAAERRAGADAVREEALEAAKGIVTEFSTFTFDDLDPWQEKLLSTSDGTFRSELEEVMPGLRELLAAGKVTSSAAVTHAAVASVTDGTFGVLVCFQRTVSNASAPTPDSVGQCQYPELRRIDGRWRLTNLTGLQGSFLGGLVPQGEGN